VNVGLIVAIAKGGKAILWSKPVRLALARYILDGLKNREAEAVKVEEKK
jgi:hypothetical protein